MVAYGPYFRGARALARRLPVFRIREVPVRDESLEPCVFICRHKNMEGPLNIMVNFNVPVRLWTLNVFYDRKLCAEHYYRYTFTERFGWNKAFARVFSQIAGVFVASIMHSLHAIPVYRNSAKSMTTMRESLKCLLNGENLLIFPDIDYTDESDKVELYDGYLILERMYKKRTGKPLRFVPLAVDREKSRILRGEVITYPEETVDYAREGEAVQARIVAELQRMQRA